MPLNDACAERRERLDQVRELISKRRLPAPSYVLPDGTEVVPRDYFVLVDEAGGVDDLEACFRTRHRGPEVDEDWEAYLDGTYGVCLRSVTPENIVRKGALMDEIESLLATPRVREAGWRDRLRRAVDELDRLERPFSPDFDRRAHGRPPSRDRLIAQPRGLYPEIWAAVLDEHDVGEPPD
jgi:Family of unknown function (DUF6058)